MKQYSSIVLLVFLQLALFAAPTNPAQVTISLTTKVPEYLIHGFLKVTEDPLNPVIVSSADVYDAFNTAGASFKYAIRTNVAIPLKVTATVSPFSQRGVNDPAQVRIEKIMVGDGESQNVAQVLDSSNGLYQLLDFTPSTPGMAMYSYTLTVLAYQEEVQNAPAGAYESTVSIGISPIN